MNFPGSKRTKTPVPAPPTQASAFGHYYDEIRRALEAEELRRVVGPAGTVPPAAVAEGPPTEAGPDGDVASSGRS
jgi:hypothetical protein